MRAWPLIGMLVLAGCASDAPDDPLIEPPEPGTGDLRVIVVDASITPVAGASVTLTDADLTQTTDADGEALFRSLQPGRYVVHVSHVFYEGTQTIADVQQGDVSVAKAQIVRTVFDEPYTSQQEVAGYLFCSSNAGGVIAEECGEGAGVPCEVPVVGCERLGGAPDNLPEARFFTDGGPIRTIQAEVVWEPTLTVGNGVQEGGFTAIMATHFVCDPVCRYQDSLDDKVGHSPIIMRTDDGDQGGAYFTAPDVALADANITADTPVSVFVWTSDEDLAAVTFDQPFTVYVTTAYVLPLPEGWALVNGDSPPF